MQKHDQSEQSEKSSENFKELENNLEDGSTYKKDHIDAGQSNKESFFSIDDLEDGENLDSPHEDQETQHEQPSQDSKISKVDSNETDVTKLNSITASNESSNENFKMKSSEEPLPNEIENRAEEHFWADFESGKNQTQRSLFQDSSSLEEDSRTTRQNFEVDSSIPVEHSIQEDHLHPSNEITTDLEGGMRRRRTQTQNNSHLSPNHDDLCVSDYTQRTHPFWRTYDDIIFLSLASQLGILFRIVSSTLMSMSTVFSTDSALFTNLPLNCLSCFFMGLLCSGEDAWKAVSTRGARKGFEELREVQLESMMYRMKKSQSLLLFPGKRDERDLMQHYDQNQRIRNQQEQHTNSSVPETNDSELSLDEAADQETIANSTSNPQPEGSSNESPQTNEESIYSIAHGWDINTSPQAMSSDLLLGLRVGFCGALSSFSSWNSSMVNLIRTGNTADAVMGYIIGFALPIISYRIGIHVAVYLFVLKCNREKRREVKRGGYGIRLSYDQDDNEDDAEEKKEAGIRDGDHDEEQPKNTPSLRAIATALFALSLVTLATSLMIFVKPNQQQFAISLLFSPLGVLCRWKLSKLNSRTPSFPSGTFIANMLSCSLSGSLGSLLAGNPGEEESIVLTSMISGFAGSLSTLATFVVQVLDLMDVVLYTLDGAVYAFVTIFWGIVIGFLTRSAVDWADEL